MTQVAPAAASVQVLDAEQVAMVRLAAAIAAGSEATMRRAIAEAAGCVRVVWVEEIILQSHLFAGFPRGLNAMREWRRASGVAAPATDEGEALDQAPLWAERGAETCAVVYGDFYESLRRNIRELHPALDAWMIVEGYGKVLSRPQLDLRLRELCVVAACAAAGQERQLHSHLHGALHAGATPGEVKDTLRQIADQLSAGQMERYNLLLQRVVERHVR